MSVYLAASVHAGQAPVLRCIEWRKDLQEDQRLEAVTSMIASGVDPETRPPVPPMSPCRV